MVYQDRRDARKEEAMGDRELLTGIMADTRVAVEKPPIRGTRPIVGNILNLKVHGAIMEEILGEYDGLTQERACSLPLVSETVSVRFLVGE
jgi:uncharacterized protein (DUF433 family)